MRRTLLAALALAPLGLLAPHASAKPDLPCDYWVHGCDVKAYVCEAVDCGILP
jgi:hypothetical protein